MNYSYELLKLRIKATSKNLLLITIALLTMSMGGYAQSVFSGGNSSASYYLCNSGGSPKANGWNGAGQLGDGTTTDKLTPVSVIGLSGITAIGGGYWHSIFLKNDGSVWACGANESGQIGAEPSTDYTNTPVQVSGLSGITAIAVGSEHSLFLRNDGSVWACGRNIEGQLGIGSTDSTSALVQVVGLSGITAIGAGLYHSFFLKNDGSVWACGWNGYRQLGDGSNNNMNIPVQVSGLSGVTDISGGYNHSLFLKNDGSVWACGNNQSGQYGDGSYVGSGTPIQLTALSGITAISAGYYHSLFLKSDGSVLASGANATGQLGVGTTELGYTVAEVIGLSGITAIAAARNHSVFLKNDGSVWATGYNGNGQLGDGTIEDRLSPVLIMDVGDCETVGIEQANNNNLGLSVYPNPASNQIVIETASTNAAGKPHSIKIFNAVGQEVLKSSSDTYWNNDQSTIDISSLSSGVYFIQLFDGKNSGQAKFVKE